MSATIFCRCGKPAHPDFGDRCEDCWAEDNGHATNLYKNDKNDLNTEKMTHKEILELPISYLRLSAKVENLLCAQGVNFLEDLIEWSAQRVLETCWLGDAALEEIKDGLQMFGLALQQEPILQKQN